MNEQLQQSLAIILDKTINGIDASLGFMQVQLPDVIEQLLLWYAVKGIILALFGLIMIPSIVFYIIKVKTIDFQSCTHDTFWVAHYHHSSNNMNAGGALLGVFSGACSTAGFIMLFNIMDTIKIWIAPKIWLIEYAAQLTK